MISRVNEANLKSQVFNLDRHFLVLEVLGVLSSIYGASLHQAISEIAFHNAGESQTSANELLIEMFRVLLRKTDRTVIDLSDKKQGNGLTRLSGKVRGDAPN